VKAEVSARRFGVAAVLSVALMIADSKYGYVDRARSVLSVLVYPFHVVVNKPMEYAEWISGRLRSKKNLLEENERLREANLLAHARLQKYETLQSENLRLRELLEAPLRSDESTILTRAVSIGLRPYRHQMVIDKGIRDGVYLGQPIVNSRGLVGQVFRADAFTSTVLLITDPRHAVPVTVHRNGLRAIAAGTGGDRLSLKYLPGDADIREGDLLVSSGLGERFPTGYPVGRVTQVESGAREESFSRAQAFPEARIESSREFLLVRKQEESRGL